MKNSKKISIAILIGALICIMLLAYYAYQKAPANLINVQPDVTIIADSLVAAYENDEAAANKKYLGKIILINGRVTELINQKDTLLNIVVGNGQSLSKVSCVLHKDQLLNYNSCKVGQVIDVKGVCTGYLADVEINRAVILTETKK